MYYELEIFPHTDATQEQRQALEALAMSGSISPYVVTDEFGRLYTAFTEEQDVEQVRKQAMECYPCSARWYSVERAMYA